MLPSSNRLPASEIHAILRGGKRNRTGLVEAVVLPTHLPISRFAFVVGVSVDKRATVRNRTKRLLRESVRALLPSLNKSADVVVVAKKGLPDTQTLMNAFVGELFSQAGLL